MALQLPGIVVDIKGDSAQLKKDITVARQYVTEQATGMSNAINNALSGQQIKTSVHNLVGNLSQLSQASVVTGNAFKGLGVNLGDLQKVTGTTVGQFQKLQEQILKTQTAAQQEKALRGIATAAGLSAKEITALGKQFGLTKAQIDSVVGASTKASSSLSILAGSAKLALAGLTVGAVVGAARGLIQIADQYSLIDSKLKLVSKSSEEFATTYKELFNISQRTGSSFTTNASAFSSLSLNLRDMNVSTSDTLKMFEMLNKSLVVNGSNTQEAASFMLQFKQAMGSGKLAGDELKAMLEANSYFGTLLAKSLGVTTGALKTLGSEGKLTTDVLLKAFPAMSEQIDKDFGKITKAIARAMVELKNAFEDVVADSNRATGATGSVANSISDLAKTITENKEAISTIFQGLISGASFAVGMIGDVTRSIQGLAIVAASPSKSLGDWITSDAKEMKKWQEEIANGTIFLKDRLAEITQRRSELARIAGSVFSSEEAVAAAKAEISALGLEREAIERQILAFEGLAKAKKVAKDSFVVANDSGPGRSMASLSTVKDPWQVQREWSIANSKELYDIESKNYEAQKKRQEQAAKEREAIEQKITASHAEATKSRYEYSIWTLDQEVAKMREKAGADKELQAQITQYRKDQYKQLGDFGQMYSSDEQSRLKNMKDVWMSAEEDIQTINDERYKNQQEALDKMTNAVKSSKQSEVQAYIDAVDEELRELERLSDGSIEYEEKLSAYKEIKRRELNERLLREERKNLTEMQRLWKDFAEDTKRDFTDIFGAGLKGEFDTIGEAWNSLMDTMKDRFLDLVATLTVNSLFDLLGLGEITGGGATWSSLLEGVVGSGGSSSGGSSGGAGGVVGSLATTAATSYIKEQIMTEVINPVISSLGSTIFGSGTAGAMGAGASVASTGATGNMAPAMLDAYAMYGTTAATGTTAGTTAATTSSTAASTTGISAASLSTAGWMALPAIMFAASTYFGGNRQKEHTWSEQGVSADSFASLGMEVSGMFYDISEASTDVKASLNELGWGFGELDGISVDAANGLIVTSQAVRDSHNNMVEGMQYQISYFDQAQQRWRTTGDLFGDLLDEMSAINPVSADAVAATAEYVAAAAGIPTVADELEMAFLQMQSGMYDLAGAASAAGMQAAAAAAMAGSYASAAQMNSVTGQRQQRQESGTNPTWSMMENPEDYVLGHAAGGIHEGGWRLVGERGPELEYTPPSRIFSNTDTNSILAGLKGGGQPQQITIPVSIGNTALTTLVVSIADKHISVRERQGVSGRAYAR